MFFTIEIVLLSVVLRFLQPVINHARLILLRVAKPFPR
jgi:hypothetical protein